METSWLYGLAGGALIGAAASMHLLLNGRIAGTTGMISNVLRRVGGEAMWLSALFLGGAFAGAALYSALFGAPRIVVTDAPLALIASGLLVGLGVSFGNGCTSGHGVVGMSRLSTRSIAATLTFMASTALTVAVMRHGFGWAA